MILKCHSPSSRQRHLTKQTRQLVLQAFNTHGGPTSIWGGDFNAHRTQLTTFTEVFDNRDADLQSLQIVFSHPIREAHGDVALVRGLLTFQENSSVGKSFQGASDAHDVVLVPVRVPSKDAQAAATAASSSAAQPAATVGQPAEATKPMPLQEHGLERRAAAAAAEEGAALMIGPTLPPEPPCLGLFLQQSEAARAAEAAAAIPESPPNNAEQPVVHAVMTLTADPLPILGDDGNVVWQNEALPQNDSGDLPPKPLRCALSSQTPLADELMRTLADDDQ